MGLQANPKDEDEASQEAPDAKELDLPHVGGIEGIMKTQMKTIGLGFGDSIGITLGLYRGYIGVILGNYGKEKRKLL